MGGVKYGDLIIFNMTNYFERRLYMKKLISITLTLFILFQVSSFASKKRFADVPDGHWAEDAIDYFQGENIIEGVSDDEFSPDSYVTREQFAKLLSLIYGKNSIYNTESFADVDKGRWSFSYIESVKEYLTGYYPQDAAAFFAPEGKALREDIAYALAKINNLKIKENTKVLDAYKDANQISPSLREYVAAAVEAGLIYGYDEYLRPQDFLTRAEAVMLLYRSIKKPAETDEIEKEKPEEEKPSAKEEKKEEKENDNKDFSGYDYAVFSDDIESVGAYREEKVRGSIVAKWAPSEKKAEFTAKAECFGDGLSGHNKKPDSICEIKLEELSVCYRNKIQGVYSVTIDNTLKDKKAGTVYFDDGGVYFKFDDENTYFLCGEYKKFHISKEKAEETNEEGTDILLSVKSVSGNEAKGNATIHFNTEKNSVKIKADYTVEGKKYKVTLTSFKMYDDYIEGLFKIECDGKTIAEDLKGEMEGPMEIGEEWELEIGELEIKMIITEISK